MKFESKSLTPGRSARHFFGSQVRQRRESASMSLPQLAALVCSTKSTLARVETGEVMPRPELARAMDEAFDTGGFFKDLYEVARRELHPDQHRRFMDFEAKAEALEHYAGARIPGLLQTEAYAREQFRYDVNASEEEVERRVAARMSRQDDLRADSGPHLWFVLDEVVLQRAVGGPEVMHEQLEALLPLMDCRKTKVQVLPLSHGGHMLAGGATVLLKLPNNRAVAYEEGWWSGWVVEDHTTVREAQRFYDALRGYALSPRESAEFIKQTMERYEPC
jgi:transcriptional regulator with XRE-family HTH domain